MYASSTHFLSLYKSILRQLINIMLFHPYIYISKIMDIFLHNHNVFFHLEKVKMILDKIASKLP